jgi:Family of unknown function (DUF6644)
MAVNLEELIFPTLECIHIAGFAVAIGTTAIVDFRILDLGFQTQTPAQLTKYFNLWMLGGLLVAIFSGFGIYSTDPDMYYTNWPFLIKMACLAIAIVFHYTIHRKVAQSGGASAGGKLVAVISLLLWISVIFGGIFIAFIASGL